MAQWLRQTVPPSGKHACNDCLVQLNDKELLFVPRTTDKGTSLWKFNITDNHWEKFFDHDADLQYHTASLDKKNKILFLFSENGRVYNINLNTQKLETSETKHHDGSFSKSFYIDGKFHIFFGYTTQKFHYI